MIRTEFAPAKVNLYLHVGPLGTDGYHPIESWMVFADVGDEISIDLGAQDALTICGPFGKDLPQGANNLVGRAREALRSVGLYHPYDLRLNKVLPPASGLGGGSSDAAATLRLLGTQDGFASELSDLALQLGSDVPACLVASSLIARGRGQQISPGPAIPPLPAVLVNPCVPVSTAQVFGLYDQQSIENLGEGPAVRSLATVAEVVEFLRPTCNDLEGPAVALQPIIAAVLAVLRDAPETRFARMSGSGATCFALCDDHESSQTLAERLAHAHPQWWVKSTILT